MTATRSEPSARAEAREVAESAREAVRTQPSFAAEVFLGRMNGALIHPFPEHDPAHKAKADPVLRDIEAALRATVDPEVVERQSAIPEDALKRLEEAGAFRLKLPEEYGGLGLSQTDYGRAVALAASWCGTVAVRMSGHQSIGVSTPLKLFGTKEQKEAYLPRLAAGELSGFALTEPDAGSDPARLQTTATPSEDGEAWILDGEKLWCTNGPVADILIVMARTPDKVVRGRPRKQISAFIVEATWPGFEVAQSCRFMGYGGIESGRLRFKDLRVPKENLLGGEGRGLKLALVTLNTGRLTLPATNVAAAKQCVQIVRNWARTREQWGGPIASQEAVALQAAWIAAHTFAMEAVCEYPTRLVDRGGSDIRLEAAIAKLFCSETLFQVVDRTLQIRGGRGYETAASLAERGEPPIPVERLFREARVNRILEGTSEIMHLFIAREAVDPHLRRLGALAEPGASFGAKALAVAKAAGYYPWWYLKNCLPVFGVPAEVPAPLRRHWRYAARGARRLARRITHAMARYGAGLEHRQGVLGRIVDEGVDLVAMSLTISHATAKGDAPSVELADLFCRHARVRIAGCRRHPSALDGAAARLSAQLMQDRYIGLEDGVLCSWAE